MEDNEEYRTVKPTFEDPKLANEYMTQLRYMMDKSQVNSVPKDGTISVCREVASFEIVESDSDESDTDSIDMALFN